MDEFYGEYGQKTNKSKVDIKSSQDNENLIK